ncbi:MFS transporter, DHA1 family, bicyclomycin/chloramphenicol resistance protein [Formosa sp. Hel1_31_208]|uniref:multidrug effflux MFS transporter n=1 Tax=Formosa sp. Hel1_31_208 TaxID=1798225 RepID=UPI00087D7B0B|nr:multidrug effflux MFS transporter [Formosa sp. Hel1_31_208]SDS25867.1 MFS transporter, DHA1 family, bicyclomycin/chloramphenicol resistance protein [Formosa sp. Hel1_31_208]
MQNKPAFKIEFIALMASLMSIVALSIDALLPALPEIGNALNVSDPSDNQLLITMIFLGLGFGQLIFGPLSDSFGRKPMVYFGFTVFVIASIICVTANSLEMMIFGRILQGIGLSSPRTIAIAMTRDTYSGDFMAKILSVIVMFFILVPIIAPTFGQLLLDIFNWKAIFNANLIIGLLIVLWFWKRQPETLELKNRIKFSPSIFITGTREFLKHKDAIGFTLVSGFITGSFMVYLSTSQQIFQEQYQLGELFPYIFASTAFSVGFATFTNSRLVIRFGSFNIAYAATIGYAAISVLYVLIYHTGQNPSIGVLISFFLIQFFSVGFLFGNLRSLAMEPLGHIAGIGAAINGFVSTVMAVPIANYIGSFVKTSVLPLFIGFSLFGILSLIVFLILKRRRRLILNKA